MHFLKFRLRILFICERSAENKTMQSVAVTDWFGFGVYVKRPLTLALLNSDIFAFENSVYTDQLP